MKNVKKTKSIDIIIMTEPMLLPSSSPTRMPSVAGRRTTGCPGPSGRTRRPPPSGDGPLCHRRHGDHDVRRRRPALRQHRQRRRLGVAASSAGARVPARGIGDAGRAARAPALRDQRPAQLPGELSDRFARRAAIHSWEAVAHRSSHEVPLLEGTIATLECELHDVADGGDHAVVIGHVVELEHGAVPRPIRCSSTGAHTTRSAPPRRRRLRRAWARRPRSRCRRGTGRCGC